MMKFHFKKHMKPAHRAICRSLAHCLILGETSGWLMFKTLARYYLSEEERASMAFSMLRSLDQPHRSAICTSAFFDNAGAPFDHQVSHEVPEDAAFWGKLASSDELEYYLIACLKNLPQDRVKALKNQIVNMEVM